MGTTLVDILARAKAGKLLVGHTILITKKVKPDFQLCSRVVHHAGGIVSSFRWFPLFGGVKP